MKTSQSKHRKSHNMETNKWKSHILETYPQKWGEVGEGGKDLISIDISGTYLIRYTKKNTLTTLGPEFGEDTGRVQVVAIVQTNYLCTQVV